MSEMPRSGFLALKLELAAHEVARATRAQIWLGGELIFDGGVRTSLSSFFGSKEVGAVSDGSQELPEISELPGFPETPASTDFPKVPNEPHPALSTRFSGVSTDSRHIFPGSLFIALIGESFDGADFAPDAIKRGAAGVIVARDRARELSNGSADALIFAVDSPLRALGLLAHWHRQRMPATVIAITGSNGKTTTKELIRAALSNSGPVLATQGNLNNEIGAPLTLLALRPEHRFVVIELGMSAEGEIARLVQIVSPDVGVVTNVAGVHLEGLGSLEGVSRAKGELFHGLPLAAQAVANADDPLVLLRAEKAGRSTLLFGRGDNADLRLLDILSHDSQGLRLKVDALGKELDLRLSLVGLHNASNALAALAAALAAGVSAEAAAKGLENLKAPEHRLQIAPLAQGATLLDDCYNANPSSMNAALLTLSELAAKEHRIAVLGDMRELGPNELELHRELGEVAAKSGLKALIATGPLSKSLAEGALHAGMPKAQVLHCEDVLEAAEKVREILSPKDWVLIKASRGMRLERVAEALLNQSPPARTEPQADAASARDSKSEGSSETGSKSSGSGLKLQSEPRSEGDPKSKSGGDPKSSEEDSKPEVEAKFEGDPSSPESASRPETESGSEGDSKSFERGSKSKIRAESEGDSKSPESGSRPGIEAGSEGDSKSSEGDSKPESESRSEGGSKSSEENSKPEVEAKSEGDSTSSESDSKPKFETTIQSKSKNDSKSRADSKSGDKPRPESGSDSECDKNSTPTPGAGEAP